MKEDLFSIGKEVLALLKNNKYEAYFVGGCVRDYLLNKTVKDIDITTNATPEQVRELFKSVVPIGIDHGTVLVRYRKQSFEITTYRTESTYSDRRHPDAVKYVTSIEEDLKRRDFTINALAMDENKNIIDLFEGRRDLTEKILRAVGNPRERFMEDPLRMIRALRFSAQLGFSIEAQTFQEMVHLKDQIKQVAQERITDEIIGLFSASHVNKGIDYLKKSGIYKSLPIFSHNHQIIDQLPKNIIPLADFGAILALFHLIQRDISISSWKREWKGSNESKRNAHLLVEACDQYKKLALHPLVIYPLPEKLFPAFTSLINILQNPKLTLKEVNQAYQDLVIQSPKQLAINGSDLLKLFPEKKPGRWIQELLKQLTEQVLTRQLINDREELKEWVKCQLKERDKGQ